MTSRRWCFTLNNYDEAELESLRTRLKETVRYAIFGKEIGSEGTPHLQGYVSFGKTYRQKGLKLLLGDRCHVEVAKGTEEQNYLYCSKGKQFEEFGTRSSPGKRNDIEAYKADVIDRATKGTLDIKALRQEHSIVFARYPRFCLDYINDNIPKPLPAAHPLRDWQARLNERLRKPAGDREIIFIVDVQGNAGKTWFAKYFCYHHDRSYYMRPSKVHDMAHSLPSDVRVLFLDCTRQQLEFLPYSFLESVKDGMVFSPKYESHLKYLGPVHVVVLMNEFPDNTKLSRDRYTIIDICE